MTAMETPRVMLIDSNVLFVRRITAAMTNEGFEMVHYAETSYALTSLERETPVLILCATEFREMGAFEMVALLRADPKTSKIPVMALGNGVGQGQLQAFRSGCDDYIDRRRNASEIASYIHSFVASSHLGFQPTQMLSSTETSLSGNLAHLDLAGVMQMLGPARKTGALHINAGETDAIIFFDLGELKHAEYGKLTGDDAVIQVIKDCYESRTGVYKFIADSIVSESTVRRSATDLLLDAMRELDEVQRETAEKEVI